MGEGGKKRKRKGERGWRSDEEGKNVKKNREKTQSNNYFDLHVLVPYKLFSFPAFHLCFAIPEFKCAILRWALNCIF